jgi:hypothetical protein
MDHDTVAIISSHMLHSFNIVIVVDHWMSYIHDGQIYVKRVGHLSLIVAFIALWRQIWHDRHCALVRGYLVCDNSMNDNHDIDCSWHTCLDKPLIFVIQSANSTKTDEYQRF